MLTASAASTSQTNHAETNAILLQRLEGTVALGVSLALYAWLGQSWLIFALLFLVPDIAMLGYLRSARLGAYTYNAVHTYVAPAVLALAGLAIGPLAYGIAAIWVAHIGFDRMLGYGLKFTSGFKHSHLGALGQHR